MKSVANVRFFKRYKVTDSIWGQTRGPAELARSHGHPSKTLHVFKLDVIDGTMENIHQCCGRDELSGWLITVSVSCPLCSHNWIANALLLQRLDGLFLDRGVTLDQEWPCWEMTGWNFLVRKSVSKSVQVFRGFPFVAMCFYVCSPHGWTTPRRFLIWHGTN